MRTLFHDLADKIEETEYGCSFWLLLLVVFGIFIGLIIIWEIIR